MLLRLRFLCLWSTLILSKCCEAISLEWLWRGFPTNPNSSEQANHVQIIPDDVWDTIVTLSDNKERAVLKSMSKKTRQVVDRVLHEETVNIFKDHTFVMQGMMQCIREYNPMCLKYGLSILEERTLLEYQKRPIPAPSETSPPDRLDMNDLIRWRIKQIIGMAINYNPEIDETKESTWKVNWSLLKGYYRKPLISDELFLIPLEDERFKATPADIVDLLPHCRSQCVKKFQLLSGFAIENVRKLDKVEMEMLSDDRYWLSLLFKDWYLTFNRENQGFAELAIMQWILTNQFLIKNEYVDEIRFSENHSNLYWIFLNGVPFSILSTKNSLVYINGAIQERSLAVPIFSDLLDTIYEDETPSLALERLIHDFYPKSMDRKTIATDLLVHFSFIKHGLNIQVLMNNILPYLFNQGADPAAYHYLATLTFFHTYFTSYFYETEQRSELIRQYLFLDRQHFPDLYKVWEAFTNREWHVLRLSHRYTNFMDF